MAPATILFLLLLLLISSLSLTTRARRRRLRRRQPPLPPGPRGWPLFGNLFQLGSKPHQTLQALSKAHRSSSDLLHLRFGVADVIVVSSASAAARCFCHHDASLCDRPQNSTAKYIAYGGEELVMSQYGARWRAMRRLCARHLFAPTALEGWRSVREEEAGRMAGELRAAAGSAVRVFDAANACASNVLARVLVGRRVALGGEFLEMVAEATRLAGVFNVGDFLPWLHWLDLQGVASNMKKIHRRFDDFFEKILAEHRLNPEGCKSADSFLGALTDVDEEQDKLTDTNIKGLLQDLFIAGMEPTSITVEWALAELIRNPSLLSRAQREIDSVVGRNRLVSELDLPNLPFLHAVANETYRLHPAAPLSVPRAATEDCEVGGRLLPEGAMVLVNIWAIGRDPASWPDRPLAFRPDRFLPGGDRGGVEAAGSDFELMAFGAGRRICAGMSFARRFVLLATSVLVHAFDWTAAGDGDVDLEEAYGATLRKAAPLVARPVPRLAVEAYL